MSPQDEHSLLEKLYELGNKIEKWKGETAVQLTGLKGMQAQIDMVKKEADEDEARQRKALDEVKAELREEISGLKTQVGDLRSQVATLAGQMAVQTSWADWLTDRRLILIGLIIAVIVGAVKFDDIVAWLPGPTGP